MQTQFIQGYLAALKEPTFVPMAIKVALVVGSLLFTINHGPALLQGNMTPSRWISAIATYGVPYAVNIHGQYVAQRRSLKHSNSIAQETISHSKLISK